VEIETTIRKAAASAALKSCNNLWKETKQEEKKLSVSVFISSELNLISQGHCKRVISRISYKVAICQLSHNQPSLTPIYLMPPSLFSLAANHETTARETSQQTMLHSAVHLHKDPSQILSDLQ